MYQSTKVRLNRMFNESGKCLDVAVDHGVFNEYDFLDGLENMESVVWSLVNAGPDAIQTNYGQSDILQRIPGKSKPALVMRVDYGNPYNAQTHKVMFSELQNEEEPILEALRMDASCIVVNLLLVPGEPALHRASLRNISRLRGVCDRYGMPMMIEPLVMKGNDSRGGYQVDGNKKLVVPLVRQARELGADVIKADPTDHVEDYHEVVEAARCPVLVRGGGKADLKDLFTKSYGYLQQGAMGLVYGRNIYQHPNPSQIVKAFMQMIHNGATPEAAWQIYSTDGKGN
ncbi:class I fructose-bisphosphate aldolase [Parapedobacter indicus]|uniref:Fructose-bisphosphate aldolase class Ia, DhnA family n=1 Tax=Parapedobacter indicus TaxID=1477437 RepID=A0A1I3G0P3_9SPHI|nr:aldolase [Parapedobacter indicus]PPL03977.1 DhnA family fructose-bisphosphate aldolase class Ia [Parapedobacter indicus]SFI17058.1 Fructose-bisphosphate aldolase class Ia, DhnA family [Parapedobacter indicus]